MFDEVFGEIEFDCGFVSKKNIDFFGDEKVVDICIDCDEGEDIIQLQRDAYETLMQNWDLMQRKITAAILKYYNEEEKGAYGPEDEKEFAQWWPDIENEDELAKKIHLDTIIVPNEHIMESFGRAPIYVLFNRDWGGKDLEDNGVAVFIEDGEVSEVGYKYIAF